jgi:hypothetical protein
MEKQFKPQISLWKRKEPSFKCWVLRFLTPVAGLLDSLITLCSFTLLVSNFEMEVIALHAYEYFKALKSARGKLKGLLLEKQGG